MQSRKQIFRRRLLREEARVWKRRVLAGWLGHGFYTCWNFSWGSIKCVCFVTATGCCWNEWTMNWMLVWNPLHPLRFSYQLWWVTHGPEGKWKVVDPLIAPFHICLCRKTVWDLSLLAPNSYSAGAWLHLVLLLGSEAGTVLPTRIQEWHQIIARGVRLLWLILSSFLLYMLALELFGIWVGLSKQWNQQDKQLHAVLTSWRQKLMMIVSDGQYKFQWLT